jgi:glycosyltransferase involved in cell wall biosynthesis
MKRTNPSTPIQYSIVVPFYNEEENIKSLYERLKKVMEELGAPYELIFVDDGSTDKTYGILNELYQQDETVHVIKLRRNFGQSSGLAVGFDFSRGEIIIPMDGDLQHCPEDIPKLLAKIKEGYDIVSGWREERKDPFLTRRLPSRVANWLMAKLSGVPIHDFGTTFKAYRREVLDDIYLYTDLHRFIPALASYYGYTITEVPIQNVRRKKGKSKYGLARTYRVLFDLVSIKFFLSYSVKPLQFFGMFGFSCIMIGGTIETYLLVKKILYGTALMVEHGPLFILATMSLILGVQFIMLGLLGEMITKTYHELQNKPIYSVKEIKTRHTSLPSRISLTKG